jgi:hypothetical protein
MRGGGGVLTEVAGRCNGRRRLLAVGGLRWLGTAVAGSYDTGVKRGAETPDKAVERWPRVALTEKAELAAACLQDFGAAARCGRWRRTRGKWRGKGVLTARSE